MWALVVRVLHYGIRAVLPVEPEEWTDYASVAYSERLSCIRSCRMTRIRALCTWRSIDLTLLVLHCIIPDIKFGRLNTSELCIWKHWWVIIDEILVLSKANRGFWKSWKLLLEAIQLCVLNSVRVDMFFHILTWSSYLLDLLKSNLMSSLYSSIHMYSCLTLSAYAGLRSLLHLSSSVWVLLDSSILWYSLEPVLMCCDF